MAIPRSQQINTDSTPYYHCMNRCVRRTYLCGKDNETGRDYNHRKEWLVSRMKMLTNIFAINIAAFAVMSNHYHLVLHVDESKAQSWCDEELKARWAALFPRDAKKLELLEQHGATEKVIEDKLNLWRERLASISWFMRCLNEPIARRSNLEDKITGRFWEGRFKSQALLDEASLLSAMVYVDLNPIRAGVNKTPEESKFTSIYDRIKAVQRLQSHTRNEKHPANVSKAESISILCNSKEHLQPNHLLPIKLIDHNSDDDTSISIDIQLSDYIELVDYTGRHIREDKRGAISDSLAPILERIELSEAGWFKMATKIEEAFAYAVGKAEKLAEFNKNKRQRIIRGYKTAKIIFAHNLE